jgi:hypothetical protein
MSTSGAARPHSGQVNARRPHSRTEPGVARVPRTRPRPRRRRRGPGPFLLSVALFVGLAVAILLPRGLAELTPPVETGPDTVTGVPSPRPIAWSGSQPRYGVDISFPQCGRTLRNMPGGYAIVGLDGGMPDRPNPCFASQWQFATRQSGAAVYVNTADNGRGDPVDVGRRAARGDLAALREHGIDRGTPVWLDVELPEVWRGSQARHRAVITEHMRVLAEAGYPVGVYSAPALWAEISGGAELDVPTWVGIGRATPERAAATCQRQSFGGKRPAIVQRIGWGTDGLPLDRNLTCPGTDLTGLVRPR